VKYEKEEKAMDIELDPATIRRLIDQANKYFDSGQLLAARDAYKRIKKMGVVEGHIYYRLALFYRPGRYMVGKRKKQKSNDYLELALQYLPEKAARGDVEAQGDLAYMYDFSLGVPADLKRAVELYKLAADGGLARAQYNLGYMYSQGDGVPLDNKLSLMYFKMAADQGDHEASYHVGELSKEMKDYATAFRYFIFSAPFMEQSARECTKIFFWRRCTGIKMYCQSLHYHQLAFHPLHAG